MRLESGGTATATAPASAPATPAAMAMSQSASLSASTSSDFMGNNLASLFFSTYNVWLSNFLSSVLLNVSDQSYIRLTKKQTLVNMVIETIFVEFISTKIVA